MKIKEITLYTNKLKAQKYFYQNTLGFDLIEENEDAFSIQIGASKTTFQRSKKDYKYHYCFLIPSNKLDDAIKWISKKLDLIKIEGERVIQRFDSWNAESVYFFDGDGSLAEFIVRYDLDNATTEDNFDINQIISFNEIGMTTRDVAKTNAILEKQLNSSLWKGGLERFGVNGTQEGLFLLVNYELKKSWFPTQVPTQPSPFKGIFESEGKLFNLVFENEEIHLI